MGEKKITIDELIDIVSKGGCVKTGVDVYDRNGVLLLAQNEMVSKLSVLLFLKSNGVKSLDLDSDGQGGVWPAADKTPDKEDLLQAGGIAEDMGIAEKIEQINALKKDFQERYEKAHKKITDAVNQIKETGGEFDVQEVGQTIQEMSGFLMNSDPSVTYFTKHICNPGNYLFNHSINVCILGFNALKRFNENFNQVINNHLCSTFYSQQENIASEYQSPFIYYLPDVLKQIALGYFLHDIGKVLVDDEILFKSKDLSYQEQIEARKHSYELGPEILDKNGIQCPYIANIVRYHHAPLYSGEGNSYPDDKVPVEIPPYVKICKLADIYDAMTSKRVYADAINPTSVISDIFRKYAGREPMLQFLLHAFIKEIGVCPAGSIISLNSGQMAYVIDSRGPLVIPFTDAYGATIESPCPMINLSETATSGEKIEIDRSQAIKFPIDVYSLLPKYLKELLDL